MDRQLIYLKLGINISDSQIISPFLKVFNVIDSLSV